jgi:hypothetical protein
MDREDPRAELAGVVIDSRVRRRLNGGRPCRCTSGCLLIAGNLAEQHLGALTAYDPVRHRIGVLLVRVAGLADSVLEQDAAALLDDVRCLVRGGVQIG